MQLVLVGEAPGATEAVKGTPFVGPAGKLLNKLLIAAGTNRNNCFVTNVIPVYKENVQSVIRFEKGEAIYTNEFVLYKQQLIDNLNKLQAPAIVALGSVAMYALTGKVGIHNWRGSILTNPELPGKVVIPTYHPSHALHAIKKDEVTSDEIGSSLAYQHVIAMDLKKALSGNYTIPTRNFVLKPSIDDIVRFLTTTDIVGLDIETDKSTNTIISIAIGNHNVVYGIPIGYDYYSYSDKQQFWEALRNVNKPVVGHNIIAFDAIFLLKQNVRFNDVHDTMVLMRLLAPELPATLEFITSIYTNEPYYKHQRSSPSLDEFLVYNCKDVIVCLECFDKLKTELQHMGNWHIYEQIRKLANPLWDMSLRGLRIDINNVHNQSGQIATEIDQLKQQLAELAGKQLNPNSAQQLVNYFYTDLGLEPYRNPKTHKPTVDNLALKRLARKGVKEAAIIMEIRKRNKLKSTYLDVPVDEDGRLRASFDPVGAGTGRLASKRNVFGTGTNVQNLPKPFKNLIIADDNCTMYEIDLKQAENKIVAYIAPEHRMIEAFEKGIDLHTLTATTLSGLSYEEVLHQHKQGIKAPLGSGNRTWREWGKTVNHAMNYGLGIKKFALQQEISERDAKILHEKAHQLYPGIRQYHAWVKRAILETRTLTNCFGRKRRFLDDLPEFNASSNLYTKAFCYIPQSTVADLINQFGLNYIYYNEPDVQLLNQIHDAVLFQIPNSVPDHLAIIKRIVQSLEHPIQWQGRTFVINAEVKFGVRYGQLQELKIQ